MRQISTRLLERGVIGKRVDGDWKFVSSEKSCYTGHSVTQTLYDRFYVGHFVSDVATIYLHSFRSKKICVQCTVRNNFPLGNFIDIFRRRMKQKEDWKIVLTIIKIRLTITSGSIKLLVYYWCKRNVSLKFEFGASISTLNFVLSLILNHI